MDALKIKRIARNDSFERVTISVFLKEYQLTCSRPFERFGKPRETIYFFSAPNLFACAFRLVFHFSNSFAAYASQEEWREDFTFVDLAFVRTAFAAGGMQVSEMLTEWWSRRARLPLRGFVADCVVVGGIDESFEVVDSSISVTEASCDGIVSWLRIFPRCVKHCSNLLTVSPNRVRLAWIMPVLVRNR